MNYENIRLDINMYKSEKGFSNALEVFDPSKAYCGTELSGLDAYQRQLKRFDIKVGGANSDYVAKFFQTADSAVLFPEYIKRATTQGMREIGIIDEILASKTNISSLDYRSVTAEQRDSNNDNNAIPEMAIKLNESLVRLNKRGRLLNASYEVIKFQRLDILTVALKQIGAYIAKSILKDAIDVLAYNCEIISIGKKLSYPDIVSLWGVFENFEMNALLVSPDIAAELLTMKEFQGVEYCYNNIGFSPMCARLLKTSAVPSDTIIALDRNFALEMVQTGGINVEYDKLIDAQLERAAITQIAGFSKIFPDAVKIMKVKR